VASTAASPGGPVGDLAMPVDRSPLRRLLDPDERFAEVLFGLIMVVTITGTISVTAGGREDVGTMLRAALGCNLAWGIADAVMYALTTLILRGRGIVTLRAVRSASDPAHAHAVIADALPPVVSAALTPADLEAIRQRLAVAPEPPTRASLGRDDILAAIAVCLLVFLATFPVIIPFFFVADAKIALRVSNGIAIAMLFGLGWAAARQAGGRPWRFGLAMVLLGVALVAAIVALGG
jgi:VIT1/CCC1 family predicted Fe2+/Mn2+ transporter